MSGKLISLEISGSSGGLTEIYNEAFEFCNSLKEVEFRGTKEQFKSIEFNAFNKDLLNARIICTDGII